MPEKGPEAGNTKEPKGHPTDYVLANISFPNVTLNLLLKHISADALMTLGSVYDIYPTFLTLQAGAFASNAGAGRFPGVAVTQAGLSLRLSCSCAVLKTHLCQHQALVLQALITRPELRVFFDGNLRREKIKPVARDYGLADEENLDAYFELEYADKTVKVKPRLKELLPVNSATQAYLTETLLPKPKLPLPQPAVSSSGKTYIVVLAEHKYYKHLYLELYVAPTTRVGKLKNPLQVINPSDLIWITDKPDELKFYTAISKFQRN